MIIIRKFSPAFIAFVLFVFSSQAAAGSVSRAQFTSEIIDREPQDTIITLSTDQTSILFFSELSDFEGQSVSHQWVFNDKVWFEKAFAVSAPRWRVWSSKTLPPHRSGTWTVNILDPNGNKLLSQSFEYR